MLSLLIIFYMYEYIIKFIDSTSYKKKKNSKLALKYMDISFYLLENKKRKCLAAKRVIWLYATMENCAITMLAKSK